MRLNDVEIFCPTFSDRLRNLHFMLLKNQRYELQHINQSNHSKTFVQLNRLLKKTLIENKNLPDNSSLSNNP